MIFNPTNFNPRAPRGARRRWRLVLYKLQYFNPRAPRGARQRCSPCGVLCWLISIHAPREGRDLPQPQLFGLYHHFNPRAPRGARPLTHIRRQRMQRFQSTRPARGATAVRKAVRFLKTIFQSTRPARGATKRIAEPIHNVSISIHAPREGRDNLNHYYHHLPK